MNGTKRYALTNGVITDTARVYCDGTTEEMLADLHVFDKYKVATKVAPRQPGDHQPERLKAIFQKSLETLKTDKVDIFYLHAPVSDESNPSSSS